MERHRGMPSVRLCTSLNQRRLRGPANGEAPSEAMGFEGFCALAHILLYRTESPLTLR
jgi:hypothetical protein